MFCAVFAAKQIDGRAETQVIISKTVRYEPIV